MKLLSLITFLLIGCANLRHATNMNIRDLKNISHNTKRQKQLNRDIKTLTASQAKPCSLVKEESAKDNVLDKGEKFAILYLKIKAEELDANAIVIDRTSKAGDYGHVAEGRIYVCPVKKEKPRL